MGKTKSNLHSTLNYVVDVNNANGQLTHQMLWELNVLLDQRSHAHAYRDNPLTDTHVKIAQQVQFKARLTLKFVLDHNVVDNTKFFHLSMPKLVELAKHANGLNMNQMLQELDAMLDHLHNAIA